MTSRRTLAVTLAAVLSVTLGGCGSAGGGSGAPGSPSASSTATAAPGSGVPRELAFTAATVTGDSFDASSLAGKDTVLWFWAPWCTVCARSAPTVKAAAAAHPEVTFVGVAGLSSDSGAMKGFVARHEVGELTHLADTQGHVYTRFGVTQQHTFVLVGEDGSVTRHAAYGKDVDLADLVRSTFG